MTELSKIELLDQWLFNLHLECCGPPSSAIEEIAIGGAVLKLSDLKKLLEWTEEMHKAVPQSDAPAFDCKAYDAHCPSMTVRFQVPTGFPLAGGIFRIQQVRTATPEDTARFAHLPDAPETL